MQQYRKERSTKKQQYDAQQNAKELQKIIALQVPIVEKIAQKYELFQQYYQQLAKSLSDTTHRMPVEGIHVDSLSSYNGVDAKLVSVLQQSRQTLVTMQTELRALFNHLSQVSATAEQLSSAVQQVGNEISKNGSDLGHLHSLALEERSLVSHVVQQNQQLSMETFLNTN